MFQLVLFAAQDSAASGAPRFGTLKSDAARQAEHLELKAGDILRFPNLLRKGKGSTEILHAALHFADNPRSWCIWQSRRIPLMIKLLDRNRGGGAELHCGSRKR